MRKLNCWEFNECGREPGGAKKDLGICPAAIDRRLHGVHDGKMAGRACWVVAGTMCGGTEQGTFAKKYHNCEKCNFYKIVRMEEGLRYTLSVILLKKLEEAKPVVPAKNPVLSYASGTRR